VVSERLTGPLFTAATRQRLEAGRALFAAGDVGDGCYRLDAGLLKVEVASPRGEARIIALLDPGAIVGELSMIDGQPRSASVFALRECLLSFVSREDFNRYVTTRPETCQELLAILSVRLREANAAIADAAFLSVRARVASALNELAEHVGQPDDDGRIVIDDTVSRGDIAAMAGVARENVSRVFREFRQRNLMTLSARRILLNDIAALRREMELR
jgi:CRP/FNR family cyclic AMP-dependent transcriptional regulator